MIQSMQLIPEDSVEGSRHAMVLVLVDALLNGIYPR
jgi:hypothetical protein